MRTTLTLDEDVAVAIERRRRERSRSLKQEVNELLRVGLEHVDCQRAAPGLRLQPWDAGDCLVGNLDDIERVLAVAEGEDHS